MGKTTVYLHIGAPKTGTSALQYFLLKNHDVLSSKGIEYPVHPVDPNGISSGNGEQLFRSLMEDDYTRAKNFIEEVLKSSSAKTVISSEYLYGLGEACMPILKEFLSQADVKIIVYFRRQDSRIASAYNQWIKRLNLTCKISPWVAKELSHQRFSFEAIEKWSRHFGKDNMHIRVYEKQQFVGGDIFSDFLNILGLAMTEKYERPPKRINTAYRTEALEFMRLLNLLSPDVDKIQVDHLLQSYSECMETEEHWPYSLMSPADRHKIIEYFSEANAVIARDYLGRSDGRLFFESLPDLNEPWKPYPGLSDNEVRQIASFMTKKDYQLSRQIGLAITQALESQDKDIQKAAATLAMGLDLFIPNYTFLQQSIIDLRRYCHHRLQRTYHKLLKKLTK